MPPRSGQEPPQGGATAAPSPWRGALLVIGALAALHVGAGLLLTRGARNVVAGVEAAWSADELAAARDPGAPPATSGAAYATWKRAQGLWEDSRRHDERSGHVQALTLAALGSFAVQAGAVVLLALRASCGRR